MCPTSFEAKSELGYTPLYLACLMGRVRFAKTLIDAGADQSIKDKEFNNIIHACVTNNPNLDLLRQMLDLFDPQLRAHMFRQRNNLSHGGDTPLHMWMKNSYIPAGGRQSWSDRNDTHVKLLRLLLEFSKGEELEILNGSGDTVLHTAVLRSFADHARVILEQNPKLLYRENTVGRTPGEIAYDLYTNSKVAGLDSIEISIKPYKYLVEKNPEEFLPKAQHKKSSMDATWDVVQEHLAKTEGKRRLVSLNEANDVARRLGERYSWQRYYTKRTTNQNNEDEANDDKNKTEVDFVTHNYNAERRRAWYVEREVPGTD